MSNFTRKLTTAAALAFKQAVQRLKPAQVLNDITKKTQFVARTQNSKPDSKKDLKLPTLRQQTPDATLTLKGKLSLSQNAVADNSAFKTRVNQSNAILASEAAQK